MNDQSNALLPTHLLPNGFLDESSVPNGLRPDYMYPNGILPEYKLNYGSTLGNYEFPHIMNNALLFGI